MQKQFVLLFVLALFAELATVFSQDAANTVGPEAVGVTESVEPMDHNEHHEHHEHEIAKMNMNCDGIQEKCVEACQKQLPELFKCNDREGYECICRKWVLPCLTIANCGVVQWQ